MVFAKYWLRMVFAKYCKARFRYKKLAGKTRQNVLETRPFVWSLLKSIQSRGEINAFRLEEVHYGV